jgi:hypothetical protein
VKLVDSGITELPTQNRTRSGSRYTQNAWNGRTYYGIHSSYALTLGRPALSR